MKERAARENQKKPTSRKKHLKSSLTGRSSGEAGCTARHTEPATTDVTKTAPPRTLFNPTCVGRTCHEGQVLYVGLDCVNTLLKWTPTLEWYVWIYEPTPKRHHVLIRDWTACSKFVKCSRCKSQTISILEKKENLHFIVNKMNFMSYYLN